MPVQKLEFFPAVMKGIQSPLTRFSQVESQKKDANQLIQLILIKRDVLSFKGTQQTVSYRVPVFIVFPSWYIVLRSLTFSTAKSGYFVFPFDNITVGS